jgi:serine/threonine protein kinase
MGVDVDGTPSGFVPESAQIEEDRRKRLRLWLDMEKCPDLLPLLDAAAGSTVDGRYRIDGLAAAGRQFFVWIATELSTGRSAILKQARFDYRRPVHYGRAEIERLRAAIRREYEVLWADRSGTLPRPLALLVTESPVPAAAVAPSLARNEVFVVEEHVRGLTLTELSLRVWPDRQPGEREAALSHLAADFVNFWEAMHSAGWYYGDVSGDNFLIEEAGRLRVVDGGSAIPAAKEVVLTGFTPAFTTPRIYARASVGQSLPGSLASILPLLGKILHFALTRREPINGHLPDLGEPVLQDYSPLCRLVVELLTEVDHRPEQTRDARDALIRWAGEYPRG